jgi:hypothetical protein
MQTYELLCRSANGFDIIYRPQHSHTAAHFKDAPGLREIVSECLSSQELDGEIVAKDINMGRTIGETNVVETTEADEIVYAIRAKRKDQGYVPFTKSQTSHPSSLLSVYLVRKNANSYELLSTWIGEYDSPNFPQMENATIDSMPFWRRHAFVWGSQEIIAGSERMDCPW